MDGEKKPLVMSELGCADGCGRQMGGENGVDGGLPDGCGRRGCNGVAGNGWGEEQDAAHEPECSHTRMLMYMQSLRTIFCNSLFEQSCIYIFPL